MKKIIFIIVLCIASTVAIAMNIQNGNSVIISQPIQEDLYIAGGVVTINAHINGDLIITGGTIIINDTVSQDIIICGGQVTLNSYVGDDIRGVGGDINIKGEVFGDLAFIGGNINIDQKAIINGSVLLAGGNLKVLGLVKGNLKSLTGSTLQAGTVEGRFDCKGDNIEITGTVNGRSTLAANKIIIGSSAAFYQDVLFWTKGQMLDFKTSMKHGDGLFEPTLEIDTNKWQFLGFASLAFMLFYLTVAFIFIILLQNLFGNTMKKAADEAYNRTLRSMGVGALFFLAIPAIILLLIITIIGIPLGLILLLSYLVILSLVNIISSIVTANWISNRFDYKWGNWQISFMSLLLFVLLKLLSMAPVIGILITIAIVCLAIGAIIANIRLKRNNVTLMAR